MSKVSPNSDNAADDLQVSLVNEQSRHAVDEALLVEAANAVLRDSAYRSATISLAVVDDATIHELNRQYLNHDWPTDVLSFVLEQDETHLEGEVIISADTAAASAAEFAWPAAAEQFLYVLHGTLHLVGYGDKSPKETERMRSAEVKYLRQFGFEQPRVLADRDARPSHRAPDAVHRGATGR
jgi:probable rRNA maturation factor